jgi:hypothetical protein
MRIKLKPVNLQVVVIMGRRAALGGPRRIASRGAGRR